jgi:hypothetical protein
MSTLDPRDNLTQRQTGNRTAFFAKQQAASQLDPPFPYTVIQFPFHDYGLGPETIKPTAADTSTAS